MIESLLIQVYVKNIDSDIAELSNIIAIGKCENFEDYKKKTGIIIGLKQSKEILNSTINEYKESDIDYSD